MLQEYTDSKTLSYLGVEGWLICNQINTIEIWILHYLAAWKKFKNIFWYWKSYKTQMSVSCGHTHLSTDVFNRDWPSKLKIFII